MFEVYTPPADYADPWSKPFCIRQSGFRRKAARVAYLYERADSSTFRYRAYNMVCALDQVDDISAQYFFLDEIEYLISNASEIDVVVLCRVRYNHKIGELIQKLHRHGGKAIFDCDDLVFDNSYAHLIAETLNQDVENPHIWDYWFSYMSRLGATLRLCDGAIVTNDFLAARLTEFHPVPVKVVRNFMNDEQLRMSHELYQEKAGRGFTSDNRIHIGYFSGTPSHEKDFSIVEASIAETMDRYENLNLLIVGYLDKHVIKSMYPDKVELYGMHDFVNLQRVISFAEINIVPLQDNIFTNCKSELKFFEAAAVGTLSVATPTFTYRGCIRDGETGWLAKEYNWGDKLAEAVESRPDYPAMAAIAHEYVLDTYSPRVQVEAIRNAVGY